jgi:hypothetical protein
MFSIQFNGNQTQDTTGIKMEKGFKVGGMINWTRPPHDQRMIGEPPSSDY